MFCFKAVRKKKKNKAFTYMSSSRTFLIVGEVPTPAKRFASERRRVAIGYGHLSSSLPLYFAPLFPQFPAKTHRIRIVGLEASANIRLSPQAAVDPGSWASPRVLLG